MLQFLEMIYLIKVKKNTININKIKIKNKIAIIMESMKALD